MELFPDLTFHDDLRLMIWRPRGIVDQSTVDKIVESIDALEVSLVEPFNRFTDTLTADMVDLNFQHIFRVSLYRRIAYSGAPVKSAVLVNSSEIAQYWKLHAMLTKGSSLDVRLFRERDEAAAWLEVPIDRLS
jgi:hypothetical protein